MHSERGIALIIVLSIVALLTITVTEFTYSVQLDQHRVRNAVHALQASLLARSGINIAEGFLMLDEEGAWDGFTEQWWLDLDEFCRSLEISDTMHIQCKVEDESGKINVNLTRTRPTPPNAAGNLKTRDAFLRDALRRMFEAHGIKVELVDDLKDYWLKEPTVGADGRLQAIPAFGSLEDFGATFGIPTPLLHRLRPLLTAQPANVLGAININTAKAEVLAAVVNDPQVVSDILAKQVEEEPFTNAGAIKGALGSIEDANVIAQLFNVRSSLFRLQASALTNVDPSDPESGGIGQTLSVLVARRVDPRRKPIDREGPGWTLRPLDWQIEGGARLLLHPEVDDSRENLDANDEMDNGG